MKKTILYFQHSGNLGGAPKSLQALLKEVDRESYDPYLFVINDGPAIPFFKDLGLPVIVDKKIHRFMGTEMSGMNLKLFIKNILGVLPTYFRSKIIIKKYNPSIIHLNTTCMFISAMAAKRVNPKIKIISHVREPLLKSFSGKILKYMNNKYVDYFIPISKYDESTIKQNQNSEVIYNPVNFEEFNKNVKKSDFRKEFNISDENKLITFLGRIVPQNGIDILIETANLLREETQIKFAVIGFNNEKDDGYQKFIRNKTKLNPNVHLIEFRKDIPSIINSSDIIVFPSVVPHFARSIIEAGAMAKPSIASNIGGPDELIINGETGLLVPPGNSKVLAEAIKFLADDKNLRITMGQKAFDLAKENYDSKVNAKRVFKIYEMISDNI